MVRERVVIRSKEEIALSRHAGELAAQVLAMIGEYVRPGVTTDELDRICHDFIVNDLKAIPVIAVTAFAMKGDEEKIREGGCEAYIAKPISVANFLQTVARFCA